ncbi:HAD family hydrolase [Ruicaihuangia caeni]|uniref:HAD family phosphatase n=1 Tax=Ruicaihuangia caeni TaxID=3042517 RepID=A0AAW6T8J2_9MICO|nr:HAD family phosphatase [Klugiella sp. YN-L-19]MDI2098668.1 HAD family phosphatase [Klugiella sp. YN-L-19]
MRERADEGQGLLPVSAVHEGEMHGGGLAEVAGLEAIDAIVFDMDGVLVDTPSVHRGVWLDFVRDAPWDELRAFAPGATGRRSRDVLGEVLGHRLPPAEIDAIVAGLHERFLERSRGVDLVFPQLSPVLDDLSAALPLAVATSAPPHVVDALLGPLAHTFAGIITGADCTHGKPHPEVYRRAVSLLRHPADRVLAIEDTVVGVTAAVAAGCRVWAVDHQGAGGFTEAGAEAVAGSAGELAVMLRAILDAPRHGGSGR